MRLNCGESYIEHWLKQMDTVKEDLPHLSTARVVMFENFTIGERSCSEHLDPLPPSPPPPPRARARMFTQKPTLLRLLPPTRLVHGAVAGAGGVDCRQRSGALRSAARITRVGAVDERVDRRAFTAEALQRNQSPVSQTTSRGRGGGGHGHAEGDSYIHDPSIRAICEPRS